MQSLTMVTGHSPDKDACPIATLSLGIFIFFIEVGGRGETTSSDQGIFLSLF